MSSNTVKIAITLPRKNFLSLETLRRKLGSSRSALIDEAIKFWLNRREEEALIRQYEEGYRKNPESVMHLRALEKAEAETLNYKDKWQ